MFNLFVSIKPNIQKFTLLIEKVIFQEKQYKILIFSTKFEFNKSLLKIKKSIRRKIFIFFSFKKKNEIAQGREWPNAGQLPLLCTMHSRQSLFRSSPCNVERKLCVSSILRCRYRRDVPISHSVYLSKLSHSIPCLFSFSIPYRALYTLQ